MRSDTFTELEHKVTRFPIPERPQKQHERASQGLRAAINSQDIEQVSEILPRGISGQNNVSQIQHMESNGAK